MAINITNETIAQYMASQPLLSSKKGVTVTKQSLAAYKSSLNSSKSVSSAIQNTGTLLLNNQNLSSYAKSGGSLLNAKTTAITSQSGGFKSVNTSQNQSYSVSKNSTTSGGSKYQAQQSTMPGSSGAVSQDGDAVPSAYLVKISSQKMGHTVVAILQQEVSVRITSEWEPFIPVGGVTQLANSLAQAAFKVSLQTRFTTRRIWKGTSPIEITLTFRFESIDDSFRNVIQPCQALMMMTSPESTGGVVPFLAPPGPSPFAASEGFQNWVSNQGGNKFWSAIKHIAEHLGSGDNIIINIGQFLSFSSVIIKEVNPVFATRMGVDGLPISATCTVTFQSYEILTKSAIQGAFG